MTKVKGKFIKLTGFLMMPGEFEKADEYLIEKIGIPHAQIDDEAWFETEVFNRFKDICAEESTMGNRLYFFLGKRVYPTIKRSVGLPPELKTPLDFIRFEAQGYLLNHEGDGIAPRVFIHAEEKDVLVEASTPGYKSDFMRGVFAGILAMCEITTGKVEYLGEDRFHVTW